MPRPKQPPEYFEARTAINQHLFRHHNGALGEGMLAQRLSMHEQLHEHCRLHHIRLGHEHADFWLDGESDVDVALRMLREGKDGQGDT